MGLGKEKEDSSDEEGEYHTSLQRGGRKPQPASNLLWQPHSPGSIKHGQDHEFIWRLVSGAWQVAKKKKVPSKPKWVLMKACHIC